MKYIVYQTTNKINGKIYIGVHKTENPYIFDGYIGNGICVGYSINNPKTAYQHALKKYGYKNFIRSTLKVFDNLQDALNLEEELVTPQFVKQKNNYNTAVGGGYLVIYKTIYQFNNKKELVKTWEGNYSVKEFYGISLNMLQYAIHNKKILFDSYFSYDETPNFEEYSKYRVFTLYQFDLQGNLINTFNSTRHCSEELKCSFKSLETAATEHRPFKNYYWTHNPDNILNIIKINDLYKAKTNNIIKVSLDGQIVEEYFSMKDAAKLNNIPYYKIKSMIKNQEPLNNYYFKTNNSSARHSKVGQYNFETGELVKVWDNISTCAKQYPKAREVVKGFRKQTKGYTFKFMD